MKKKNHDGLQSSGLKDGKDFNGNFSRDTFTFREGGRRSWTEWLCVPGTRRRTHTQLWLKSRPLPTAWLGRRQIQSSPQRCTGLTGSTQAETTTTCLLLEDAEACYSAGHQVYSLEGQRSQRNSSSTSSSLLGPPASYVTVFLFQVHFHHNHMANLLQIFAQVFNYICNKHAN